MHNILETELISDEQMMSLVGGRDSCVSCTTTKKKERGDTTTDISPKADFDVDDLLNEIAE